MTSGNAVVCSAVRKAVSAITPGSRTSEYSRVANPSSTSTLPNTNSRKTGCSTTCSRNGTSSRPVTNTSRHSSARNARPTFGVAGAPALADQAHRSSRPVRLRKTSSRLGSPIRTPVSRARRAVSVSDTGPTSAAASPER